MTEEESHQSNLRRKKKENAESAKHPEYLGKEGTLSNREEERKEE